MDGSHERYSEVTTEHRERRNLLVLLFGGIMALFRLHYRGLVTDESFEDTKEDLS